LRKPGRLTEDETAEIRQHPDKGWAILADLEPLAAIMPGLLQHHEMYNGNGYPDQLAGEEISIDGRILAVADAYDAMTSDRPYRQGMPHEQAVALLRSGSGTQWDPQVVDTFLRVIPDLIQIRKTYRPRVLATRPRPVRS
jgi:HD-GYP domain-containing protein (c-di-GMP phosphodiesterase class II)